MTFYVASIGQLLIVNLFVFYIWVKVLAWTLINKPPNPQYVKLIATSGGLVITSLVLVFLMVLRAVEIYGHEVDVYIMLAYALLAIGNLMFILSASIGTKWNQFKIFLGASFVWNMFFVISNFKGI